MQYVQKDKSAVACQLCGSIVQTIKTVLPNTNVKIEYGCPICGTREHEILKNPTVIIMAEDKAVDKPNVKDTLGESTDKLSKKINKALSRK